MTPWTSTVAVALAVALAAVNGIGESADPQSGKPAAVLRPGQVAGPVQSAGEGEQMLLVTPGGSYDLAIRSDGAPLEVIVRLHDGASLGGSLAGPGLCKQKAFATNVIALSTSGQVILYGECGAVAAGDHVLHIAGGSSAFLAKVQLSNATFLAA